MNSFFQLSLLYTTSAVILIASSYVNFLTVSHAAWNWAVFWPTSPSRNNNMQRIITPENCIVSQNTVTGYYFRWKWPFSSTETIILQFSSRFFGELFLVLTLLNYLIVATCQYIQCGTCLIWISACVPSLHLLLLSQAKR